MRGLRPSVTLSRCSFGKSWFWLLLAPRSVALRVPVLVHSIMLLSIFLESWIPGCFELFREALLLARRNRHLDANLDDTFLDIPRHLRVQILARLCFLVSGCAEFWISGF